MNLFLYYEYICFILYLKLISFEGLKKWLLNQGDVDHNIMLKKSFVTNNASGAVGTESDRCLRLIISYIFIG